jgi:hypothetical protein
MTRHLLTFSHVENTWLMLDGDPAIVKWSWKSITAQDARTLYDAGYRILDAI